MVDTKEILIVRLDTDDCQDSSRDWDNLGTMYCTHRRYTLGDKQFDDGDDMRDAILREYLKGYDLDRWIRFSEGDTEDRDWATATKGLPQGEHLDAYYAFCRERQEYFWDRLSRYAIALPLYLYDHSGITMNTSGFSCPWDSGQVGWIIVSNEQVRKEYDVRAVTKKIRDKAVEVLKGEVSTYDMDLRGEVFHYSIETQDGEHVDSCGGFYGSEYFMGEVRSAIESYMKDHTVGEIVVEGDASWLTDYHDLPKGEDQ